MRAHFGLLSALTPQLRMPKRRSRPSARLRSELPRRSVSVHRPVMLSETIDALDVRPGGRYIDGTIGEGGHASAILEVSEPGGQLLGFDADREAVTVARSRLGRFGSAVRIENESFAEMRAIAIRYDFVPVHGVLLDLGMSSLQLDRETRGFSFRRPDPLDMRFSLERGPTASDIVNGYAEGDLSDLIYRLGEERASRRIASAIVSRRPIETSQELATIVEGCKRAPSRNSNGFRHPATKTFQALRIAVNDELRALEAGLGQAISLLGHGGRLVVISYHSLEDRIVKTCLKRATSRCICPPDSKSMPVCTCKHEPTMRTVVDRSIAPSKSEVADNPRSRSARLRVAQRI